ncbi:MAG: AraC family transcriptional regulator [Clostridiales bacterium]|nr:AraC family transcriptional regulator [Clostridiales bacterium]
MQEINWISGTPIGYSVFDAVSRFTLLPENVLEIILCLRGEISFFDGYEDTRLQEGEFISVDSDAYYLHGGKNNLTVSLYLNLEPLYKKYPLYRQCEFILEGYAGSKKTYPTLAHINVQGMILGILSYLLEWERDDLQQGSVRNRRDENAIAGQENEGKFTDSGEKKDTLCHMADTLFLFMVNKFDALFYWSDHSDFSENYIARYHEISSYIRERPTEHVTLSDLSREFHLTESYLSEFLRKSGLSFKEILFYYRSNIAERLLLTSNKTMAEIADLCGFSNVKIFTRYFKKWHNCTPGEFRKMFTQEIDDDISYKNLAEIEGALQHVSLINQRMRLLSRL